MFRVALSVSGGKGRDKRGVEERSEVENGKKEGVAGVGFLTAHLGFRIRGGKGKEKV